MSKYKVGDKVVLTVTGTEEAVCHPYYVLNDNNFNILVSSTDKYAEPLSTYTEPLEAKIKRQAAEITRLLAENKRLKAENGNSLWNTEQARAEGQNEAWELARKIASTAGGLSSSELVEIFNAFLPRDILSNNTYPEAAAKVAEWEKAKEIKVGDVLEDMASSKVKCVVTNIYPSNMAYLVFSDGSAGIHELENMKKTGRHIDIDGFLKQIGGEVKNG